jgi:hypothetical protein
LVSHTKERTILKVFENRVLRRSCKPKVEEVAEGWRRLHIELHNLYASSDIIRVMKSMRIRWAGNVTCMGEILVTIPEDLGLDGS